MPNANSTRRPLYHLGRVAYGREATGWMVEILKLDSEPADPTIVVHLSGDDRDAAVDLAGGIADALNEAQVFPWGDGPAVKEVGADVILAWDGHGWNYAVFEGDPSVWWWRDVDEPVLDSASHWRHVLKPPTEAE